MCVILTTKRAFVNMLGHGTGEASRLSSQTILALLEALSAPLTCV